MSIHSATTQPIYINDLQALKHSFNEEQENVIKHYITKVNGCNPFIICRIIRNINWKMDMNRKLQAVTTLKT